MAIDGKTLRGSHERGQGKKALHLVSAWATESGPSLGQVAVEEKSNEITAIPQWLEILDLRGALVTIDAMGCQKDIAANIREREADYVLAVKENQERLYQDIEALALASVAQDYANVVHDYHDSDEKNRGRHEFRACYVIPDLSGSRDHDLWKDLACLIVVVSDRCVNGVSTSALRYYLSSRVLTAEQAARVVRQHGGIENTLHWILDVNFDEDGSRVRNDRGSENLGLLRRSR